jgi:hypothetical protein
VKPIMPKILQTTFKAIRLHGEVLCSVFGLVDLGELRNFFFLKMSFVVLMLKFRFIVSLSIFDIIYYSS